MSQERMSQERVLWVMYEHAANQCTRTEGLNVEASEGLPLVPRVLGLRGISRVHGRESRRFSG
jgi:hypothetical protein